MNYEQFYEIKIAIEDIDCYYEILDLCIDKLRSKKFWVEYSPRCGHNAVLNVKQITK